MGQSGLTAREKQLRDDKKYHIRNYEWAQKLNQEIPNWKGAQKGYGKGHGKGAKSTMSKGKKGQRSFDEMSPIEQYWVKELWSGRLYQYKEAAASKCWRIEAKPFTIDD